MTRSASFAQPVNWDRHKAWSWQSPQGFDHARDLRSVPITSGEAVHAASSHVLVFEPAPDGPMPHALLRLRAQGSSPFVGHKGQWQASWLPPRLSAWPFDLVSLAGGGHALALHENSAFVLRGDEGHPIFAQSNAAPTLAPETARNATILQKHAEALPATARACAALADLGLLKKFEPEPSFLITDPQAAAALDDAGVLALHHAGSLALLYAGLVSHAHLVWMEKAEQNLTAAPPPEPIPTPNRQRMTPGSRFLAALAAEPAAEVTIQLPGMTGQ